jgi:hypothetical protein
MAAAWAPADDAAPRCIEVPEMETQLPSPSRLIQLLLRSLLAPERPAAPATVPRGKDRVEAEGPIEPPGACGWFDSSHELVHGLQVQELDSPESLAAALPLSAWLHLQLEGCGLAQRA